MTTIYEKVKWELFKLKRDAMYLYGKKHNKIFAYDEKLISRLRSYYFGPLPLSVLLLLEKAVDGFCYDCAPLIVYGFLEDEFEYMSGDTDSIKLNPDNISQYREGVLGELYGEHAIIVRKIDEDLELVYDVSLGLIFEKDFYFKLENFKTRVRRSKNETIDRANFECTHVSKLDQEERFFPPSILSLFEKFSAVQEFYTDDLANEFKILKEKIYTGNLSK